MTVKQNYVSSILSLESKEKEEKESNNGSTDLMKQVDGSNADARMTTATTTMLRESNETSPNRKVLRPQRVKGAPDGGFGWWVVFASFMIHVIADGVTYTFGIFYFELIRYFASGKGLTAWVPSIMTGMTFAVGPIASGLTNKFGCRAITAAGAVLAAFGLAISIYAPSVVVLLFTIGVCTGAGFGLIYLPAIVSVTCYFDRKRAFATGIAVCGSGVGAAIFAPFTDMLIKALGWKGSMVIIAALVLTCSIFGILFRPLEIEYEDDDEEAGVLYEEEEASDVPMSMREDLQNLSTMREEEEVGEEEDGERESLMSGSMKRRPSDMEKGSDLGLAASIAEEEEEPEKKQIQIEAEAAPVLLPSSLPKQSA